MYNENEWILANGNRVRLDLYLPGSWRIYTFGVSEKDYWKYFDEDGYTDRKQAVKDIERFLRAKGGAIKRESNNI